MEKPIGARPAWWPVLAVVAAALGIGWQLRGGYWIESHERIWYPVRLVEYVEAWRAGAWYPRWCPDLYGGYGYPFFDYYAPGVFAAGGALMKALELGPAAALKLQATLFGAVGGVGMYGLARGETRRADVALVAALIFVFAPYRTTDLFIRGDLAEHAGFSLVPLALWGHRALWRVPGERVARTGTLAAMAHAAVLLCHTLTGLFTTEILFVALAIRWWRRRADPDVRRRAPAIAVTLGLGVAMASVYILPALAERDLVRLDALTAPFFSPEQNGVQAEWLLFHFFSIGLPALAGAAALAVLLAVPRLRRYGRAAGGFFIPVAILFVMMLRPMAFLFHVLPFGRFIQFPWRLLGFIAVFASLGCASLLALVPPSRIGRVVAVALGLTVIVTELPYQVVMGFSPRSSVPSTADAIRRRIYSTVVANEYLPQTVNDAPVFPRERLAETADGDATVTARQKSPLAYELTVDARGPATIDVSVFSFPGWQLATDSGPGGVEKWISPRGLVRITIPAAGRYELRVWFGSTPLRSAAAALSWLALLGVYPILRRLRRPA